MKFTDFIRSHEKEIIHEWVKFAEDNISDIKELQTEEVKDHIKLMLEMIVRDMNTSQTGPEQELKSKGNKIMLAADTNAANRHGSQRADIGFDIMELSSEFRALRASILRLWEAKRKTTDTEIDFQDMIRFNETIDELWMISILRFQLQVDESRNWFMGILGHDLRNPLAAISGVQSILKLSKNISDKERSLIGRADSSVKRITELVNNLLELTNLRLGNGMSIDKAPADLTKQCEKIVQELQLGYPEAEIIFKTTGPLLGEWDVIRLEQLMTNLITNALRHGKSERPVTVSISFKNNDAFFKVHNEGPPISKDIKDMISNGVFTKTEGDPEKKESYGLGLYIIKKIVDGHNGEIQVISDVKKGTTFTITLPRY